MSINLRRIAVYRITRLAYKSKKPGGSISEKEVVLGGLQYSEAVAIFEKYALVIKAHSSHWDRH